MSTKYGITISDKIKTVFMVCMRNNHMEQPSYFSDRLEKYFQNPEDYKINSDFIYESELPFVGKQTNFNLNFRLETELVKKIKTEAIRHVRSERSELRYLLYLIYLKEIADKPALELITD